MTRKLTAKQEKFAVECATGVDELGMPISVSEAYRRAYNYKGMKPESVNTLSSALIKKIQIASRVKELRQAAAERAVITVEDLIKELEEARMAALCAETAQSSAAVAATMGKAKLLGMDKQTIDLKSSDGTMSPKSFSPDDYAAAAAALVGKLAGMD